MPTQKTITQSRQRMGLVIDYLCDQLKSVRTGRASTGLVEAIKVDYYGTSTPLRQLATLGVPQVDLIVIKPFDPASIKDIEKAIKSSDLSIAPISDGKVIRLNIPPLSEERRKQIVGQLKQTCEQAKVNIRNIRRETIKELEQAEKDKTITEDEMEKGKKQVDDLTKEHTDKIENIMKSKSDEIMLD
ncbi:MAG: ribosome recycling factor [Planctomycetota bacterium]